MFLKSKNKALLICLLAITFLVNHSAVAQEKEIGRGYYVNVKGEKVEGVFDFEFINNNLVRFKSLKPDATSAILPIDDVKKIVLPTNNKDSSVILMQDLILNGVKERIYVQYLQRGGINLFRGYSKVQNEVFYVSTTDLPDLRRVNRADPKQFLFTYFKGCEDAKYRIKGVTHDKSSIEFALREFAACSHKKMEPQIKAKTQVLKRKPIDIGFSLEGGYLKPAINPGYAKLSSYKLASASGAIGLNLQVLIVGEYSISCGFNYVFNNIHTTGNTALYPNLTTVTFNKREFIPIELKYRFKKEQKKINYGLSLGLLTSKFTNLNFDGYQSHPPSAERGYGFFVTGSINTQLTKKLGLEIGSKVSSTYGTLVPPTSIDRHIQIELLNSTLNFNIFARILLKMRE